jgi:2-dehydropantoate 2-reductase
VTVAVLGAGAVGAMIACRVAAHGTRVICIARVSTAAALRDHGVVLERPDGVIRARPEVVELVRERVDLLVVAVKAPSLAEALERVEVFAVADGVVLPLLNGLEHPDTIRRRLGPRVAPGSISRYSGELRGPGHVRERSTAAIVTAAPGDVAAAQLDAALQPLRDAGLAIEIEPDERLVLWTKAARLAALAAATSAAGRTVGELRADPAWRARIAGALDEACAVAAADGVTLSAADAWAIIDAMPAEATTSTALDVAAGRPSELDAIAGSVLRAARRLGVPCPTLAGLVHEAERR